MNLSTLVKSSFILSGMLGIKLQGVPDGKGSVLNIETSIPFASNCENKTIRVDLLSQHPKYYMPSPSLPIGSPNRGWRKWKSNGRNKISSKKVQQTYLPRKNYPTNNRDRKNNSLSLIPPGSKTPGKQCGELSCLETESCVSWKKAEAAASDALTTKIAQRQANTTNTYFECTGKNSLGVPKINPDKSTLCPQGLTHAIIPTPQPCLREMNPCSLAWRYRCVPEPESPHDCKKRKCGEGRQCFEQVVCAQDPPCVVMASCISFNQ